MLGIYGGTFDPVHYGHLRTALEVREALGLDEVRFIPCRHPPHRPNPGATAAQRLDMLKLALARPEPGLSIDTRELTRSGPSYMVDTLASLRSEQTDASLCLILGLDAFRGLTAWHDWHRLFELAHCLVMRRPGVEADLPEKLAAEVHKRLVSTPELLRATVAGHVYYVEVLQLDISATQVRQSVSRHRSARYLTPDAVLNYITDEGLYRF